MGRGSQGNVRLINFYVHEPPKFGECIEYPYDKYIVIFNRHPYVSDYPSL